jgi:peptide/nickel transport system permease protein
MAVLIVRRVLSGAAMLALLAFVTYFVANEIPQNKACLVIICTETTTRAEMHAALHHAGIDRPLVVQYGHFVWGVVRHGSLGNTWSGYPVFPTIKAALPPTLSLVGGGMLLLLLLAVPLAALAALRPRSPTDRGVLTFSLLGLAVHPFVLGILLREGFARGLGAPRYSYCPLTSHAVPLSPGGIYYVGRSAPKACGGIYDWATHLAVPWFVFALFFAPLYIRMIRARLVETLGERYVVTARAKGAGERRVVLRHALRNVAGPLLPMVALDAGTALTAAIYIETVFGIHGLGHLSVDTLSGNAFGGRYDLPFLNAIVFTIGLFVVLLSVAADVASAWLDPRVRERTGTGLIRLPRIHRTRAVT